MTEAEQDSGVQDVGPQLSGQIVQVMERSSALIVRLRQKLMELAILFCVVVLVFWVALFLYGTFFYSFMPTANFIAPVHFFYRTDCSTPHHQMCSFPVANVSLLKHGKFQVMTYGQPYQITLKLEMPESPANQELGMFLVKMVPYSKEGQIIGVSARSAILHYRSSLLKALDTLVFSPLLLIGMSEQKQAVTVELYSDFKDNSYKPAVGAIVEIHSQSIQIYKAHLYIFADFSGIRYLLYHFPITSALVGVMSNFTFLSLIITLSFLQFNLGRRRPSARPVMESDPDLEKLQKEPEGPNDYSKPKDEEKDTDETTLLDDGKISNDIKMDCDSAEVEESIPDVGEEENEESGELVEDDPVCMNGSKEILLRQRHFSNGGLKTPEINESDGKSYNGVGACLSS